MRKKIDLVELKKHIDNGVSDKEIAKIMNYSRTYITVVRCNKLGIKRACGNRNSSLNFFKLIKKEPLLSNNQIHNHCYKTLKINGINIKKIMISGRGACNTKTKNGKFSGNKKIFYLPGQENQVFDMIKDKVNSGKLGNIIRMLGMPSHGDLTNLRNLTKKYETLKEISMTKNEIRDKIEEIKIDRKIKRDKEQIKKLEEQLKILKGDSK